MTSLPHEVLVGSANRALVARIVGALPASRYKLIVTNSTSTVSRIAPHVDAVLLDAEVAGPHGIRAFIDDLRLILPALGDDGDPDTPVIELAAADGPLVTEADGLIAFDASAAEIGQTVASHIELREQRRDRQAVADAVWNEEDSEDA